MTRRSRENVGPIAIDAGAHRVKIVQLAERERQLSVLAWAELAPPQEFPTPASRDAWLQGALADAIQRRGFRGRKAVTALGTGEFEMKNVRLPPMPPEELAGAVEFEAHERFGVTAEQAEFRHLVSGQVRHGNETREEVIVFAAKREAIDARVGLLTAARLDPVALDISPCATGRCFVRFLRRSEDAATVNVFVDVGWRGTSLIVTRGAEVCFVKLFEVGGAAFTKAVAERLDVGQEEALQIRRRIIAQATARRTDDASDVNAELSNSVGDAMRPAVEQLAREVHLSLRYFSVTFRGQRAECLTFVGGEAHEPTLIPMIGAGLDIPCTVGDPLRGIEGARAMADRDSRSYQPAWSCAIGLALRGLGAGSTPPRSAPAVGLPAERAAAEAPA